MKINTTSPLFQTLQDVAGYLRKMATSIASGWGVEHDQEGRHTWNDVAVTHRAVDFFGGGTLTWTVESTDVTQNRYGLLGNRMHWTLYVASTSTGGVANTALRVRIPGKYRAAYTSSHGAGFCRDAGTAQAGIVETVAGADYVDIYQADLGTWSAAAAGNTAVAFSILFEVTR